MKQPHLPFDPPLNTLNLDSVKARDEQRQEPFREQVRDVLGLSWDSSDAAILDAMRHLQEMASCVHP